MDGTIYIPHILRDGEEAMFLGTDLSQTHKSFICTTNIWSNEVMLALISCGLISHRIN